MIPGAETMFHPEIEGTRKFVVNLNPRPFAGFQSGGALWSLTKNHLETGSSCKPTNAVSLKLSIPTSLYRNVIELSLRSNITSNEIGFSKGALELATESHSAMKRVLSDFW